jgi:hypothetical protein
MFVILEFQKPLNSVAFRHLETDCRAAQAVIFVAVVSGICYYDLPIGRDFKTICLGYSFYVLVSLLSLALLSYAHAGFSAAPLDLQAVSFDVATAIWLLGLWNGNAPLAMLAKQEAISEQSSMHSGLTFWASKVKSASRAELA